MRNRGSRLCVLALSTVLAVASGCALMPGGGSYDLEIRPAGNVASRLQSLYVIVTQKSYVQGPLSAASKYEDLLDEDLLQQYVSWAQYAPDGGTWKLVHQGQQNSLVECEVDDDVLSLSVDHDLVSTIEHCVIVLGFYGNDGFKQVTIPQTSLDANLEQIVEVGTANLQVRDAE